MPEIVNIEQAAAWDGPSGESWLAREELQNAALAAPTERLLAAADMHSADRVLDVGCGTGDTTRACARRAVDGDVLGVDLSTAMLARARERAVAEGLDNVTFEQGDAQVFPFPAAAFDCVVSRFGVMFFADPEAAFANLARATAPGGRFVAVVWQPFERNEWVAVPRAALAIGRDLPPVPSDVPGPFGLADPERTRALLEAAGFDAVTVADVAVPYWYGPDVETAVAFAREIGVLRGLLDDLDDRGTARAVDALHAAMSEHVTDQGVELDSRTWVISAVR